MHVWANTTYTHEHVCTHTHMWCKLRSCLLLSWLYECLGNHLSSLMASLKLSAEPAESKAWQYVVYTQISKCISKYKHQKCGGVGVGAWRRSSCGVIWVIKTDHLQGCYLPPSLLSLTACKCSFHQWYSRLLRWFVFTWMRVTQTRMTKRQLESHYRFLLYYLAQH